MIKFQKAKREKIYLKIAVTGVAGSGKTYSSLLLEKAGYEVIIIDSLTHAWNAEGGVLDMVDRITMASKSKNSFQAWNQGTKQQNKLITTINDARLHVIACMRSKTEWTIMDSASGKKLPSKIGLAPIQREGVDYEFSIVFDLSREGHLASVSKDRTSLFTDETPFLITRDISKKILEWLEGGATSTKEIKIKKQEEIQNKIVEIAVLLQACNGKEELAAKCKLHKEKLIKKFGEDHKDFIHENLTAIYLKKLEAFKQREQKSIEHVNEVM
jgi:hypothetical protein